MPPLRLTMDDVYDTENRREGIHKNPLPGVTLIYVPLHICSHSNYCTDAVGSLYCQMWFTASGLHDATFAI